MSRLVKVILCLLVVSCCMVGCARPKDLYEAGVPQWELRTPNPLVSYVPADADFVIASQRANRDYQLIADKVFVKFMKSLYKGFNNKIKEIKGREYHSTLEPLFLNYKENAADWGLDPQGNLDFVTYMQNRKEYVLHVTVADETKALEKSHEYFMHMISFLEDAEYEYLENQGIHGQWRIYHLKSKKSGKEISFGVHCYAGVLTAVMYDGKKEVPDHVLSAPSKAYVPIVNDDHTFLVGHINYNEFVRSFLETPAVSKMMNEAYFKENMTSEDSEKLKNLCREQLEYCVCFNMTDEIRSQVYYGDDTFFDDWYADSDLKFDSGSDDDDKMDAENFYCVDSMTVEKNVLTMESLNKQKREQREERKKKLKEIREAAKHIDMGADLLHRLGTTSWDDEVCIQEAQEAFRDIPELDWALVGAPSDAFGGRFVQKVASEALMNDLRGLVTDYVSMHDKRALISLAVGIHLGKALDLYVKRMMSKDPSEWKCQQIRGLMEGIRDDWVDFKEDILTPIMEIVSAVESGSGRVNCFKSRNVDMEICDDDELFMATIRMKDSELLKKLTKFALNYEADGTEHMHGHEEVKSLGIDRDLIVGTNSFDLKSVNLDKRTHDHLLELFIHKGLVKWFVENRLDVELTNYSNMRGQVDLGRNEVSVSFLPVE